MIALIFFILAHYFVNSKYYIKMLPSNRDKAGCLGAIVFIVFVIFGAILDIIFEI
jgi:hypothetical protein